MGETVSDPVTLAIATTLATKGAEALAAGIQDAWSGLSRLVRARFRGDPEGQAALQDAEEAPQDAEALDRLARMLDAAADIDPDFGRRLRSTWVAAHHQAVAREDAMVGQASGNTVGGHLIQAREVHVGSAQGPLPSYVLAPSRLPPDVAGFTNQRQPIEQLDSLLLPAGGEAADRRPVIISAIAGTAGVGKTALAVHWAHRVSEHFPDGQYYVNLRGYTHDAPPLSSSEVLTKFLRILGVPQDRIPSDADEQADMFRGLLAGRKVLILLDNAPADAEQLRPLIPGHTGSCVLVTSRNDLAGLAATHGARRVALDVLGIEHAVQLLDAAVGDARISDDPEAARELAQLCGRLPLALRIAAAWLGNHPQWTVADYVEELREGDRLASLAIAGDRQAAVSMAFGLSYRALPDAARRLFRRLGLPTGSDVSTEAAAHLFSGSTPQTRRLLDLLVEAHLLQSSRRNRYDFHDLLRLYAKQCAEEEEPEAERTAALRRLFDFYVRRTHEAASAVAPRTLRLDLPARLTGQPASVPARRGRPDLPEAWLENERGNLVAAVLHAEAQGEDESAWLLADALRGHFAEHGTGSDWLATAEAGLRASQRGADPRALAALHTGLCAAHVKFGRTETAVEQGEQGLAAAIAAGWAEAEADAHTLLAYAHRRAGRLDAAFEYHRQALTLLSGSGSAEDEARCLNDIGNILWDLGRLQESLDHFQRSLGINRRLGQRRYEAVNLDNVGSVLWALGDLPSSAEHLSAAVELARRSGASPHHLADAIAALARTYRDAGRFEQALELASEGYELVGGSGHRWLESYVLAILGGIHTDTGSHDLADDYLHAALQLAREAGFRRGEIISARELAALHRARGDLQRALDLAQQARALTGESEYAVLQGQVVTEIATIHRARGDQVSAADWAEQALDLHRATGHLVGEGRALRVLGDCRFIVEGADSALPLWRHALHLFEQAGATADAEELRRTAGPF
ncbi:ATP-binding protein [Streptomyces sp. NPDC002306]